MLIYAQFYPNNWHCIGLDVSAKKEPNLWGIHYIITAFFLLNDTTPQYTIENNTDLIIDA
jgi:hypothetical protein